MIRWNKKYILAIILILIVILISVPQTRLNLKTAAVSLNILIPQGDWRPLQWFTREPLQEKYEVKSITGRTLTLYIYKPATKKSHHGLVIYTPLMGPGPQDPRLINLADTFTRSGFVTIIPWRLEDQRIVTSKDVGDVVSAVLFLKNNSELRIENIALMGLSYGNGPTIAAAADSRIKENISFIISFAGYYDLRNVAQFVQTGNFSYKNISSNLEPNSYAREIQKNTLAYYNLSEEGALESEEFEKLRRALSPANFIEELPKEFFVLHSTDDRYIPYTESLRLYDALKDKTQAHLALTTIFEHGDYKKLTWENLRRHYLPSVKNFFNFLYIVFDKHSI